MSSEERQRIIGQTVEEYTEAKSTFEAVETKASKLGKTLSLVGGYLQSIGKFPRSSGEIAVALADFPERRELLSLVAEIDSALSRRMELYNKLSNHGISPRE